MKHEVRTAIANRQQVSLFSEDGSNDPLRPTVVPVSAAGVQLAGSVVAGDPDYFYIQAPEGQVLRILTLDSYASTDLVAFYAVQQGKQFTAGTNTSKMLAWDHLGPKDLGKNLLAAADTSSIRDMVLWVQQTGTAPTNYRFSISFDLAQGADITGTAQSELLVGTDAPERILALAGMDTVIGGLRNDTIDGGEGIDTAAYSGLIENYKVLTDSDGSITVAYQGPLIAIYPPPPTEGVDKLYNIERLKFQDRSLAFDAQSQAGDAAGLVLTLFGPDALKMPELSGTALSLIEKGFSGSEIAKAALDLIFKRRPTGEELVPYLWKNLTGETATAETVQQIAPAINAGQAKGGIDPQDFVAAAAKLDWTAMQLDYIGLWKSGWAFIPPND
ncbi:MAG: hypothetical protein EBS54_01265 [Betaproteobacteria bacterium]|nr:hypothetical protein [Betaproteobacteria bacterium]NDE53460.1 hypothetical protein [Actinomycetota bacterium]